MTHSRQFIALNEWWEFDVVWYRSVEQALYLHPPEQIYGLLKKNKKWKESPDWDWCEPFLVNGYTPKMVPEIDEGKLPSFDAGFWAAYDYITQSVESFDVRQLSLIEDMKDLDRLALAASKSKPSLRYVWKVYKGMEARGVTQEQSRHAADVPEIVKHTIVTEERL